MSEAGYLYGAITYTGIEGTLSAEGYQFNEAALGALPLEWIPGEVLLCRKAFSFNVLGHGTPFYRNQIIHFGASYNHLDMYWAQWLSEFENLLKTMCWNEARVYANMDLVFEGEFKWTAHERFLGKVESVIEFDFEGGPRSF